MMTTAILTQGFSGSAGIGFGCGGSGCGTGLRFAVVVGFGVAVVAVVVCFGGIVVVLVRLVHSVVVVGLAKVLLARRNATARMLMSCILVRLIVFNWGTQMKLTVISMLGGER